MPFEQAGEFVVTETGIEGSLVYAVSALLRDTIAEAGRATFHLDLLPQRSPEWVAAEVAHPRGTRSLSTHLKSRLGLHGVKAGLLHEFLSKADMHDPVRLAAAIKALPVTVNTTRPDDHPSTKMLKLCRIPTGAVMRTSSVTLVLAPSSRNTLPSTSST